MLPKEETKDRDQLHHQRRFTFTIHQSPCMFTGAMSYHKLNPGAVDDPILVMSIGSWHFAGLTPIGQRDNNAEMPLNYRYINSSSKQTFIGFKIDLKLSLSTAIINHE